MQVAALRQKWTLQDWNRLAREARGRQVQLDPDGLLDRLSPVLETVRQVKAALAPEKTLPNRKSQVLT